MGEDKPGPSPEFLSTFGEDGTDVFQTAASTAGSLRFERRFILTVLAGPQMGLACEVESGEVVLGQWQRVLFMELDRERDRRWLVKVVGS